MRARNAEDIFLTSREVGERYRLKSPVSIWQATKRGKIPKPLKIGHTCRWKLSDLLDWEKAQGVGKGTGN
jgi:predicted DNA-binding transcriptional regulator AlpA